ncbi:MAG: hypothetical protein DRG73_08810 [Deltaproteobacteria bacterium]|nr:MAG: hypothetical protein DRG73_08810 [Deltaproteobacteria bacterium]
MGVCQCISIGHETKKDIPMLPDFMQALLCLIARQIPQLIEKLQFFNVMAAHYKISRRKTQVEYYIIPLLLVNHVGIIIHITNTKMVFLW